MGRCTAESRITWKLGLISGHASLHGEVHSRTQDHLEVRLNIRARIFAWGGAQQNAGLPGGIREGGLDGCRPHELHQHKEVEGEVLRGGRWGLACAVQACVQAYVWVYSCMCVVFVRVCVCVCVWSCMCVCSCMHACACVCVCLCVFIRCNYQSLQEGPCIQYTSLPVNILAVSIAPPYLVPAYKSSEQAPRFLPPMLLTGKLRKPAYSSASALMVAYTSNQV